MFTIIEREGRYFVQGEDGELERTPEQIRRLSPALGTRCTASIALLAAWEKRFVTSPWATGAIPQNAWGYVSIDENLAAIKQLCEEANGERELEFFSKLCDTAISDIKRHRAAPNADKDFLSYHLAGWKDIRRFIALFPAGEQGTGVVATAATTPPDTAATTYPWADVEALAVRIGLRKAGRFTPADKLVASAVAGLIDALREAEMLPAAATLPTLYAAFGQHYNRTVGTDRITATRTKWQQTARKALGLD